MQLTTGKHLHNLSFKNNHLAMIISECESYAYNAYISLKKNT